MLYKNRISKALLFCTIILALFFQINASEITSNNVNVRSDDSTMGKKTDQLDKGTMVFIIEVGKKESIGKWGEHYWYRVTYSPSFDEFFDGWIFGAFVKTKVSAAKAELKSEPSKKSKTLGTLTKGMNVVIEKVKLDEDSQLSFAEWYFVKADNGKSGWINADFVNPNM